MRGFGEEAFHILVWFSHHDVCKTFTELVKAQASCRVHQPAQFLQPLADHTAQVQLQNTERHVCFQTDNNICS